MIRRMAFYLILLIIVLNSIMLLLNGNDVVDYRFSGITSHLSRFVVFCVIGLFFMALWNFIKSDAEIEEDNEVGRDVSKKISTHIEEKPKPKTPIAKPHMEFDPQPVRAPRLLPTQSTSGKETDPVQSSPRPSYPNLRTRQISVQRRRRKIQL
jgi:hypothetical protein